MTKLVDLDPGWVGHGGEDVFKVNADGSRSPIPYREKVGFSCDCPSGCGEPMFIPFENPEDGGPAVVNPGQHGWRREGTTFETLTVTPSIQRVGGCAWHGFLTNGIFRTA